MALIAVAVGEPWYPAEWWGEKQTQDLLQVISSPKRMSSDRDIA